MNEFQSLSFNAVKSYRSKFDQRNIEKRERMTLGMTPQVEFARPFGPPPPEVFELGPYRGRSNPVDVSFSGIPPKPTGFEGFVDPTGKPPLDRPPGDLPPPEFDEKLNMSGYMMGSPAAFAPVPAPGNNYAHPDTLVKFTGRGFGRTVFTYPPENPDDEEPMDTTPGPGGPDDEVPMDTTPGPPGPDDEEPMEVDLPLFRTPEVPAVAATGFAPAVKRPSLIEIPSPKEPTGSRHRSTTKSSSHRRTLSKTRSHSKSALKLTELDSLNHPVTIPQELYTEQNLIELSS